MVSKILLLLEDPVDMQEITDALQGLNKEILPAYHLQQAKNLIRSQDINLIISDSAIETGGNIFDFLKWTRDDAIGRKIPIVLLSCRPNSLARSLENIVVLCARVLGARAYISMDHLRPDGFIPHIEELLRTSDSNSSSGINSAFTLVSYIDDQGATINYQ
jgi:hypothetical protein